MAHLTALPEPVDVEDLGQLVGRSTVGHGQPVREVVAEVVTEERPHCEGVVHYHLSL